MKSTIFFVSIIIMFFLILPAANAQTTPDWIKNTAGWWADDQISETEFVNAIEFLVNNGIIVVSDTKQSESQANGVPDWIKNTAGWWADDQISETEFVNAIEFLVNVGIINIEQDNKCVNYMSNYFNDKQKIDQTCKEHKSSIPTELIPYEVKLNFNSDGFRGEEFSKEKSSNTYRIFMVGGSTMLGAEVDNNSTIPSILQKMFDSHNLEVEIINAGISGGNSITELTLIESKLVNYNPDLIIMYDGWNDISADYPISGIINNYELDCEVALENDFELIIAQQPIAGFGNKSLTFQEKINSLTGKDHNGYQLLQAKSSYDYLAKELEILENVVNQNFGEICTTYDLRDIFDNTNGSVYYDQGHVMHTGNLILAEKFFEISMKKIDPLFVSDGKFREIISEYNSISVISYLLDKIGITDETFQNELKEVSAVPIDKGDYFELKDKFGIDGILVGKDLRNIDLTTIVLDGQDLTGANLSGHDLRNIDLTNTIIRDADLSYTNLEGKNFSGIDLRGIDFSNAEMQNVDFRDAIISKTIQLAGVNCIDKDEFLNKIKNFNCAKIVVENEEIRTSFNNANLQDTKFGNTDLKISQMFHFIDFSNSDLTNSNISNALIIGTKFNNAVLDDITLNNIFAIQTSFNNAQIKNFNILNSWFQSVSFNDANMTNGNLDRFTLVDVEFIDTDLYDTMIGENLSVGNNNLNCKNNAICSE